MGDRQSWLQVSSARTVQEQIGTLPPSTEGPFPRALALALLPSVMQSEPCRQIKKESGEISY